MPRQRCVGSTRRWSVRRRTYTAVSGQLEDVGYRAHYAFGSVEMKAVMVGRKKGDAPGQTKGRETPALHPILGSDSLSLRYR